MKIGGRIFAGILAVVTIVPFAPANAEQSNVALRIYVSPNGNDSNNGTESMPFKTITGAKTYLKNVNKQNLPKGNIEVIIKEGVYNTPETILFDSEDSGTAEQTIIYKGENPYGVKFTHNDKIDSNKFELVTDDETLNRLPENARGEVYKVNLKSLGLEDYGQVERKTYGQNVAKYFELYFNGESQTLSRYPNDKYILTGQIVKNDASELIFHCEEERYKNWLTADQAMAYGLWEYGYMDDGVSITSIDPASAEITCKKYTSFGAKSDRKYYIYNLLEEIDSPGEYFLDRTTGILYLYPPEDIRTADVEMCTNRNGFFSLKNTKYINFENITFQGNCGGAIRMDYTQYINIYNCRFLNLAELAVGITGGTDSTVYGCEMYNLGGSGVMSFSGNRASLTPGNIVVENCHIHKFAQYSKTYTPAVYLYFVGNIIRNNVIHDCPHMAIGINGNDNKIIYNEIYDVCQETDDCGAMYGGYDWTNYGNVISNNYLHDIRGPGSQSVGVYLDDMLSGITVENNVFNYCNQGIAVGGGHNNTINNNIIMNRNFYSKVAMYYDSRGLDAWFGDSYRANPSGHTFTQKLNDVPVNSDLWKEAYPNLLPVLEGDPLTPKNGVITNNIFSCHAKADIADAVIENGRVENNLSTNNPITINRDENGHYSFDDRYGVFDELEGFKVMDIENVGLHDDYMFDIPEEFKYVEKTVEYKTVQAEEIDVTPLLNNPEDWDNSNAKVTSSNGILEITPGTTGYLKEKYKNMKMKFTLAMPGGDGDWIGFMLHSSVTNTAPWSEGKSYLIVAKKDSFELQRWYSGAQLMVRTIENVMYPGDNEFTNVELEISNLEDDVGTNIIFRYNGIEVFNYIDTSEEAITNPGYFTIFAANPENTTIKLGEYDPALQREVNANPYSEGVDATAESKQIRVKLGSKFLSLTKAAKITENHVMVSAMDLFNALSAQSFFNPFSNTFISVVGKDKIIATSGLKQVGFRNEVLPVSNEIIMDDGVLMIPIADIGRMLGYNVTWDGTTNMVTLKIPE